MTLFEQTVIRLLSVIAAATVERIEYDALRRAAIGSLERIRKSINDEVPSL